MFHVGHEVLGQDVDYLHKLGYSGLGDLEMLAGVKEGSHRVFGKERPHLERLGDYVLWHGLGKMRLLGQRVSQNYPDKPGAVFIHPYK